MVKLRDVVVNDKVLETVRNITSCNPDTTRASYLRLSEFLFLFFLWLLIRLFLWRVPISGMYVK
jgi:hypothetical protein